MKQFNKLNSIAFKMVSGFMVVIIFIIVLGAVSYNSSSSAMLDSYNLMKELSWVILHRMGKRF